MSASGTLEAARQSLDKALASVALVRASVAKLPPYDDTRDYSAEAREPYDALSDRFVRAVEVSLRCFRGIEKLQFAEESDTLRDLLNRMEKLGIVSSVEIWFRMRDVRNRIVHDYVPGVVKRIYDDIFGSFAAELIGSADHARNAIGAMKAEG